MNKWKQDEMDTRSEQAIKEIQKIPGSHLLTFFYGVPKLDACLTIKLAPDQPSLGESFDLLRDQGLLEYSEELWRLPREICEQPQAQGIEPLIASSHLICLLNFMRSTGLSKTLSSHLQVPHLIKALSYLNSIQLLASSNSIDSNQLGESPDGWALRALKQVGLVKVEEQAISPLSVNLKVGNKKTGVNVFLTERGLQVYKSVFLVFKPMLEVLGLSQDDLSPPISKLNNNKDLLSLSNAEPFFGLLAQFAQKDIDENMNMARALYSLFRVDSIPLENIVNPIDQINKTGVVKLVPFLIKLGLAEETCEGNKIQISPKGLDLIADLEASDVKAFEAMKLSCFKMRQELKLAENIFQKGFLFHIERSHTSRSNDTGAINPFRKISITRDDVFEQLSRTYNDPTEVDFKESIEKQSEGLVGLPVTSEDAIPLEIFGESFVYEKEFEIPQIYECSVLPGIPLSVLSVIFHKDLLQSEAFRKSSIFSELQKYGCIDSIGYSESRHYYFTTAVKDQIKKACDLDKFTMLTSSKPSPFLAINKGLAKLSEVLISGKSEFLVDNCLIQRFEDLPKNFINLLKTTIEDCGASQWNQFEKSIAMSVIEDSLGLDSGWNSKVAASTVTPSIAKEAVSEQEEISLLLRKDDRVNIEAKTAIKF